MFLFLPAAGTCLFPVSLDGKTRKIKTFETSKDLKDIRLPYTLCYETPVFSSVDYCVEFIAFERPRF